MAWEIIGVWNFVSQYEKSNSKESSSLVGRIFFLSARRSSCLDLVSVRTKTKSFRLAELRAFHIIGDFELS